MGAITPAPCSSSRISGSALIQVRNGSASAGALCFQKGRFSVVCLTEAPRLGDAFRVWPRYKKMHGGLLGAGCMCKGGNASDEPSASEFSNLDVDGAWDRRLVSIMARIGGIRDMVVNAGKKLQDYLAKSNSAAELLEEEVLQESVVEETEWDRWQLFFSKVEEQENSLAVLKFDLEEAIAKEDFQEASRLSKEISTIRDSDTIGELMTSIRVALAEERYTDAARIRDETGAGLVGWWAGVSGEGNDPFGKIISIRSSQGRLIATSYSARQLVTASPGVPLFEVFYKRDEQLGYQRQAVYLQRERAASAETPLSSSAETEDTDGTDEAEKARDVKDDGKLSPDEGFGKLMNLLKGRMPDIKLKVFHVTTPEKADTDLPKIVDQLKSAEDNKSDDDTGSSDDGKASVENQLQEKGKNAVTAEELVEMSLKLLIGRLMQNAPEDRTPVLPVRVPARIDYKSRDNFIFHIEDDTDEKLPPLDVSSSWKLAVSSQASELASGSANRVVKVSKEVAEIIRLAVNYAQRRRGLAKTTSFYRIHLPSSSSDAFNGLYVGTLAPHSSHVIQLRQKIGNWHEDDKTDGDKFEFNEYVEAVKLVGDMHVPAGQVIFRARTGRGYRLPHRGVYPDELGVVARYRGRGKVAEPGFKSPHWIDGELLLLDGKGVGFLNGAQLCFVYSVPNSQPYLILFRRAMIEERPL